ncbi:MAG TPA: IS66 family transposase, partial [Salinarimonas sp.]|nr:IS66 family transposase [Salinarimonas sp.]
MALNAATLPRDPEALQAIILEQGRRIEQLEHYVVQLRRWQFGAKSERIHPAQLLLGFAGQIEPAPSPEPLVAPPRERRRHPGRRTIPADLPAKVTVHDLPETERACPGCGKERVAIGHEKTCRLEFKPADFYQDVHLRTKYACRSCEDHVETAPGPGLVGPTERGLPGPGLLAQVIVSKFADHIPCYRQVRMFRRQGVDLALSTVVGWFRPAMELLAPIVAAIRKDVLAAPVIQTDDTVVRLIDPGLGRCRQARLWGYLGNGQVVYEFTPNRREEHPLRFLANYKGYVQADAYRGYDKLFAHGSGRLELACWAHTRRYFFEDKETDAERSMAALALIRRLYAVEDEARSKLPEERVLLRREKAQPILDEIGAWIDRESLRVLPHSPIGEAIRYAAHQWAALVR